MVEVSSRARSTGPHPGSRLHPVGPEGAEYAHQCAADRRDRCSMRPTKNGRTNCSVPARPHQNIGGIGEFHVRTLRPLPFHLPTSPNKHAIQMPNALSGPVVSARGRCLFQSSNSDCSRVAHAERDRLRGRPRTNPAATVGHGGKDRRRADRCRSVARRRHVVVVLGALVTALQRQCPCGRRGSTTVR